MSVDTPENYVGEEDFPTEYSDISRMDVSKPTWKWLESTEQLQIEAYGNDLRSLTGADRDVALMTHAYALNDEIGEALDETSWKPWDKKNVGVINKEAFKGELVDALHFFANLCVLGEISEEELWEAYREKQERNRARQAAKGGYDSKKNRCPNCRRELDKKGAYCVRRTRAVGLKSHFELECVSCDHRFTLILDEETELP